MNDQPNECLEPPSEEMHFTFRQCLGRFSWSAPLLTTILFSMFAGIAIVLCLSFLMAGRVPANGIERLVVKLLVIGVFAWCGCAVLMFPIVLYSCLKGRQRRYWAESTQLFSQSGNKHVELDLQNCSYYHQGAIAWDDHGGYRGPVRPRLMVFRKDNPKQKIAVGFTEEMATLWADYFDSMGAQRISTFPWLKLSCLAFVSVVSGMVIGALLEQILPMIGGPVVQAGSIAFVGAINGFFIAIYYVGTRFNRPIDHPAIGSLIIALPSAGLAMKWCGLWQVSVASGVIVGLLGWVLFPSDQEDDESII